jgi:hypothetical protein
MYVGRFPSHIIPIQNISLDPVTLIATLTTASPHNRIMRNTVNVFNVVIGGSTQNEYNNSYEILSILSPTQLTYRMTSNPGSPDFGSAFVGAVFQALSADGGTGTIVEGNRVYNARVGGPYHDTFSTKDIVIRNNHYYSVVAGPYQNMGSVSINFNTGQLRFSITAMTRGGPDNQTATFTTPLPHGFVGGEPVQIKGANEAQYNGTFAVATVLSPTQFTYRMDSAPATDATGTSFTYGALWQTGRWIVAGNIIDLVLSNSTYGSPIAIAVFDGLGDHGAQFVFEQVVFRGNLIRHVANASDPTQRPVAMTLDWCRNAIAENNIISLDTATPVRYFTAGSVKFSNNQAGSGMVIQGYSFNEVQYVNELATDAELAALSST